jgi:exodeoxyribonuclease V gamma subunit
MGGNRRLWTTERTAQVIDLRYSNRMEALLEALGRALKAERDAVGRWRPSRIVVPNPATAWCIQEHLVRTTGIAANLDIGFLDRLVRDCLPEGTALIDRPAIQGALLGRFRSLEGLDGEACAPVRRYLRTPPDPRRTAQLSQRLAGLLEEYLYSRPAWARAWESGAEPAGATLEACQRTLWRLVRRDLAASGRAWLTPLEARDLLALPERFGPVHLFAVGHAAYGYYLLLDALGRRAPGRLSCYALNPCREFWEDHPGGRAAGLLEARRGLAPFDLPEAAEPAPEEDPYILQGDQESLLLRRWGRAGREKIRLLNELGDWDFADDFREPRDGTALAALQRDLLARTTSDLRAGGPDPADGSLQIHACANPHREAETLCDLLWELFRRPPSGPPLRFQDVAILVPADQLPAYRAHLAAAFSEKPGIPLSVPGQGDSAVGEAAAAFRTLLQLPDGPLSRAGILDFLEQPAVRRRLDRTWSEAWRSWCADTGIVRGKDRADLEPTYFEGDLLNWDQGHRRLALGAFLGAGQEPVRQGGDEYPPVEIGTGDWAAAGAFILRTRALLAELRALRGEVRTLAGWSERLIALAGGWIGGEDPGDQAAAQKLEAALARIGQLEARPGAAGGQAFACVRELALQELQRLEAARGAGRFQGVVLGDPASLRGLPFRVVILAGLGEGRFPAPDGFDDLDLRGRLRLPGDVPPSEQDRYLFLEALTAARDRFVVSYVGRDPVTGDRTQPSPLVTELKECVDAMWGAGAARALEREHPLRRWEPERFRPGTGAPPSQASAWLEARAELRHRGAAPAAGPEPDPALGPLPQWPARVLPPRTRLGLGQIRDFLVSPLQGWAKAVLGLRQDEDDPSRLEEEAGATERKDATLLLREAFWRARLDGGDPEAAYRLCRRRLERSGTVPPGLFSELELKQHLTVLAAWRAQLGPEVPVRFPLLGAAQPSRQGLPAQPLGALVLELQGGAAQVELGGSLNPQAEPLPGAGPGSVLLLNRSAGGSNPPYRDLLSAWLDQLVLAALDLAPRAHWALLACREAPREPLLKSFQPRTPEQARQTLAALAEDLLTRDHAHLLPISAVMDPDGVPDGAALASWIEAEKRKPDDQHPRIDCRFGPVAGYRELPAADGARLEQQRLRLRWFLEACESRP